MVSGMRSLEPNSFKEGWRLAKKRTFLQRDLFMETTVHVYTMYILCIRYVFTLCSEISMYFQITYYVFQQYLAKSVVNTKYSQNKTILCMSTLWTSSVLTIFFGQIC